MWLSKAEPSLTKPTKDFFSHHRQSFGRSFQGKHWKGVPKNRTSCSCIYSFQATTSPLVFFAHLLVRSPEAAAASLTRKMLDWTIGGFFEGSSPQGLLKVEVFDSTTSILSLGSLGGSILDITKAARDELRKSSRSPAAKLVFKFSMLRKESRAFARSKNVHLPTSLDPGRYWMTIFFTAADPKTVEIHEWLNNLNTNAKQCQLLPGSSGHPTSWGFHTPQPVTLFGARNEILCKRSFCYLSVSKMNF